MQETEDLGPTTICSMVRPPPPPQQQLVYAENRLGYLNRLSFYGNDQYDVLMNAYATPIKFNRQNSGNFISPTQEIDICSISKMFRFS